jgi:serine protease Do
MNMERFAGNRNAIVYASVLALPLLLCATSFAQTQQPDGGTRPYQLNRQKAVQSTGPRMDPLRQFNSSLQALAAKVSPAVVQVLVTGYGPVENQNGSNTALIARQRSLGSGVIVSPDGYIITNAHVVEGAQRIHIVLTPPGENSDGPPPGIRTDYPARLVGAHKDSDLALLKIDATGLPFLGLDPTHRAHQGELVIALGSPEGLGNSVTMGIVSSVDRQPDPDNPMVFIQTDAPINHGNSGGPLVDVDGYLLGINTFILSESGGSQGLGFAVPARIVSFVYDRLKKFGHVDRSQIGAVAESISPLLAQGLHLPASTGVIVADVAPDGPADVAGLKIGDIVLNVDGRPTNTLPRLYSTLYLHPTDQPMTVEVLRGTQKLTLKIAVVPQTHMVDRLLDVVDPQDNLVERLGVLGVNVSANALQSLLPDLRIKTGVVVVARTAYGSLVDVGLQPGDVIHSVNGTPVVAIDDLRADLAKFKNGDAVVLQIERSGAMDYLPFEME